MTTTAHEGELTVRFDDDVAAAVQIALCEELSNLGESMSHLAISRTLGDIWRMRRQAAEIGRMGDLISQLEREYKGVGELTGDEEMMFRLAATLRERAGKYDPEDEETVACITAARSIASVLAVSAIAGDA